jgi:SAM-dependent methyltransferase
VERVRGEASPRDVPAECRLCGAALRDSFADLGSSPLANSYPTAEDLRHGERFYPLHAYVCAQCFLVQLTEVTSPEELFSEYAYFSSYSETWLRHARAYVDQMMTRLALGRTSSVVEIASNDGYLLQYFRERGVPVLGIEPARNVAAVAAANGIPTVAEFFSCAKARELAAAGHHADLVVANNVLAHVPRLNDFVAGIRAILKPGGVATAEFPHLLRLIEQTEFDTIYHEHFSYFSFLTVERVFAAHGLRIFDVDELPTHGGSLRIYACDAAVEPVDERPSVEGLRARERTAGLTSRETYAAFEERVREAKRALLEFVIDAKRAGKTIAAYGAAAKGTTLLNYCGIRSDFIDYVADSSPHKQGRFLPGTHLPIHAPDRVHETRPDYLLILPWNLKDEIMEQMADVLSFGCRFVVPIPEVRVYGDEPTKHGRRSRGVRPSARYLVNSIFRW